jgi:hypothetical protein
MQRSIKGLLCSMLYQLLDLIEPETTSKMIDKNPQLAKKHSPNDWSNSELQEYLVSTISMCLSRNLPFYRWPGRTRPERRR